MTDLPRRNLLRGATISAAAAGVAGVAFLRGQDGAAQTVPVGPMPTFSVADRAALAALLTSAPGTVVFLTEPGREGSFICRAGDAPRDPRQGLAVPSRTRGLFYERVWDGVHGRPEWFGARINDWQADCADAIEACYAACPFTQLSQADYFVRRTLRLRLGFRTMRGVGVHADEQGQGTRIILQNLAPGIHVDDVMVVGSDKSGDAPPQIHLSNFTLTRDGAATPHPSGDIVRYPAGLRVRHVIHATFREITAMESSVGFYIGGVVYSKFDDCVAIRVRQGTTPVRDYAVGYYLDGHPSFGYAGGNASLYLNRCIAVDQHPAHVDAMGLCARGAFVDSFIDLFESARIATGISIGADGARALGQTVDLHIRSPVLDGCTRFGIDIDLDATSSASVEIVDPYVYAAGPGGDRGILVRDGAGLVTLTGGQVHGDFAGGSLFFSRTRGVRVQGTKVQQASRPVVVAEASNLSLEPQINNYGKHSPQPAISCHALSRSTIRPIVMGAMGPSFAAGIDLDQECKLCTIDPTGIDPACFDVADAARKVRYNGSDARLGASGTAFTTAGNLLVGVSG